MPPFAFGSAGSLATVAKVILHALTRTPAATWCEKVAEAKHPRLTPFAQCFIHFVASRWWGVRVLNKVATSTHHHQGKTR
jgi:hypothetical protein